jgi:hypothetical protein
LSEAISFKLCRHGGLFQHGVVALLGFGRRDVADGLQEPSVVEPIHPFQGRELDGLEAAPWPAPMDHLSLVETVDGFGESVVIGISDTADRRLDTSFSQALGVLNGYALASSVAVVYEPATMERPSIMQCLLHEVCMRRARGSPAYDPAGIGVDDKGNVDKAGSGRDIGEVGEARERLALAP